MRARAAVTASCNKRTDIMSNNNVFLSHCNSIVDYESAEFSLRLQNEW